MFAWFFRAKNLNFLKNIFLQNLVQIIRCLSLSWRFAFLPETNTSIHTGACPKKLCLKKGSLFPQRRETYALFSFMLILSFYFLHYLFFFDVGIHVWNSCMNWKFRGIVRPCILEAFVYALHITRYSSSWFWRLRLVWHPWKIADMDIVEKTIGTCRKYEMSSLRKKVIS